MIKLCSLLFLCALVAASGPAMAAISYETNQSFASATYIYQYSSTRPSTVSDDWQGASSFSQTPLIASRAYGAVLTANSYLATSFGPEAASATATLAVSDDCDSQWGVGSGMASASAGWDFTFTLDEEQAWNLAGTVGTDLSSSLSLYGFDAAGDTFPVFFRDLGFATSTQVLDESGTLQAGRYWMYLTSQVSTNVPHSAKSSGFDLTFSVSEVPEPATLSLLSLGGIALLRKRR